MSKASGLSIVAVTLGALIIGFLIHLFFSSGISVDLHSPSACTPLPPSIEAVAGFALDIEREVVLYEKNADAQLPLASLTKIMTVLVASRALPPDTLVTISEEALKPEGSSGFEVGDTWRLQDLIDYTLITSSNDGIHSLALAVGEAHDESWDAFPLRMNALARSLGLSQTYFLNDTGLDTSSALAGAYGSARDVGNLLTYVTKNEEATFSQSALPKGVFYTTSGKAYTAEHTSPLSASLPSAVVAKTGFTDLAGGNLGVVIEVLPGKPVALVVLGSSREGRNNDIERLYEYAKERLRRDTLCST